MDAGFVDEENFLYIMSRSDDVINVAGHRLSSGALEEVIVHVGFYLLFFSPHSVTPSCVSQVVLQHSAVGDCAVVGLNDSLKGVVPLALCVLKNGRSCTVMCKPETRYAFLTLFFSRSAENRG